MHFLVCFISEHRYQWNLLGLGGPLHTPVRLLPSRLDAHCRLCSVARIRRFPSWEYHVVLVGWLVTASRPHWGDWGMLLTCSVISCIHGICLHGECVSQLWFHTRTVYVQYSNHLPLEQYVYGDIPINENGRAGIGYPDWVGGRSLFRSFSTSARTVFWDKNAPFYVAARWCSCCGPSTVAFGYAVWCWTEAHVLSSGLRVWNNSFCLIWRRSRCWLGWNDWASLSRHQIWFVKVRCLWNYMYHWSVCFVLWAHTVTGGVILTTALFRLTVKGWIEW